MTQGSSKLVSVPVTKQKSASVLGVAIVTHDAARRAALAEVVAHAGHSVVEEGSADVVLLDAAVSAPEIEAVLQAAASGSSTRVVPTRARGFEELAERVASVLLTPRELDVLSAIGAGLGNKAIARELGISLHTVKFHIESLFRKLGARTRAEAVAKGLERRAGETVEL